MAMSIPRTIITPRIAIPMSKTRDQSIFFIFEGLGFWKKTPEGQKVTVSVETLESFAIFETY
jgi:hypothetical protein